MKRTCLNLIAGLLAIPVVAVLITGCTSAKEKRVYARTDQTRESHVQTQEGYDTFGRKWGTNDPAAAPKPPEPAAKSASVPQGSCADSTWGLIRMTKTMPREVSLGSEFAADLTLTAQGCAANVVVSDLVPDNASYVRSEPAAKVEGRQLIWNIGNMDAGQTLNGKVWFKADKEGTLVNCATVSADPRACGVTFVGKAALAIDKTGPEMALIGADVTYNIVVKNSGNAVAHNVVVTDPVPDGLSGNPSSVNVGDLAPGQSKAMSVTFKTTRRGKVCNTASANSSNAGKVSDEACTVVVQSGLKVFKTGDKEQFLARNARYQIVVTNTGDVTLTGVVVTDTAPAATKIVAASGATVTGNSAVWNIAELKAGEAKRFEVTLSAGQAGSYCNSVTAATAAGLKDSAEACTLWKGRSAILIELVDDPDPIQVGETTTYTIRVTNQGTAEDNNVTIVANFPKEITPVTAQGGAVTGQAVKFAPVPRLAAKQMVTYTIVGKGAQAGDARIKVELNSDQLKTPVTEEESTTVY